jgi:hypothetical protein
MFTAWAMRVYGCSGTMVIQLYFKIAEHQRYRWFFKNRPYNKRIPYANFWTQNLGPKLEIYAHLGTKIAITFSFFLFRG